MPNSDRQQKHIIVIGAGAGGTATAARLAREGFKVTVVEKNDFGGGRCSLIHHNGHRFDQGPSLYLMPKLFEDTFADLDERVEDHIELLRCENNYKVHFDDGDSIHLSSDLTRMKDELDRVEGPLGFGRFLDFLKETHIHYENGTMIAIKRNFESIWDMIRIKYAPEIFKLHLFNKIYDRASQYFQTKKMRMAFTFQTMYMGMSPYDAPAVYSLLQYTEFAEGIWYPRGGFNMVVQKLEAIATKKYGAKFIYNAPVAKINTDDSSKKVTGITLENGDVIHADAVVCNADLVYAYHKLLPPCSWTKNTLAAKKLTSSSISFYWSLSEKVDKLDVHNIFLAEAYKESFDEIFKDYSLPSEPSFYVNVPSRIDPSAAPPNKDSVIVLVPIGHMRNKTGDVHDENYPELVKRARQMVLEVIQRRLGMSNFADLIENEIVNDPSIWQKKFNLWRGSILGLSHDVMQVLWFRPSTKDSTGRYDNLYFVGASTHPGTGVPIVLAGSKLTNDQVCKGFGKKPLPRKIEDDRKVYAPEFAKTTDQIEWAQYCVGIFIVMFLFFFLFPQNEATGLTPASFINNLLPRVFQVQKEEA
ncbi:phytoene dehydrogenase [Mycotypha africana]|uniref:phytoene dehydrogenase n=1 Tax=Mycotypha africana TaxID=64632 RepID=UPI002300C226|nr:phytoene dehydrogenase [Mycotypha africana]KAI8991653.1 phytoene dehydrogenase [Mycotypha africana]